MPDARRRRKELRDPERETTPTQNAMRSGNLCRAPIAQHCRRARYDKTPDGRGVEPRRRDECEALYLNATLRKCAVHPGQRQSDPLLPRLLPRALFSRENVSVIFG
jgi:hypothetical protein